MIPHFHLKILRSLGSIFTTCKSQHNQIGCMHLRIPFRSKRCTHTIAHFVPGRCICRSDLLCSYDKKSMPCSISACKSPLSAYGAFHAPWSCCPHSELYARPNLRRILSVRRRWCHTLYPPRPCSSLTASSICCTDCAASSFLVTLLVRRMPTYAWVLFGSIVYSIGGSRCSGSLWQ
jgi:hypothetical protein